MFIHYVTDTSKAFVGATARALKPDSVTFVITDFAQRAADFHAELVSQREGLNQGVGCQPSSKIDFHKLLRNTLAVTQAYYAAAGSSGHPDARKAHESCLRILELVIAEVLDQRNGSHHGEDSDPNIRVADALCHHILTSSNSHDRSDLNPRLAKDLLDLASSARNDVGLACKAGQFQDALSSLYYFCEMATKRLIQAQQYEGTRKFQILRDSIVEMAAALSTMPDVAASTCDVYPTVELRTPFQFSVTGRPLVPDITQLKELFDKALTTNRPNQFQAFAQASRSLLREIISKERLGFLTKSPRPVEKSYLEDGGGSLDVSVQLLELTFGISKLDSLQAGPASWILSSVQRAWVFRELEYFDRAESVLKTPIRADCPVKELWRGAMDVVLDGNLISEAFVPDSDTCKSLREFVTAIRRAQDAYFLQDNSGTLAHTLCKYLELFRDGKDWKPNANRAEWAVRLSRLEHLPKTVQTITNNSWRQPLGSDFCTVIG